MGCDFNCRKFSIFLLPIDSNILTYVNDFRSKVLIRLEKVVDSGEKSRPLSKLLNQKTNEL